MKTEFILVLLIFISTTSFAKTRHNQQISKFSAVVASCHDGDTCRVRLKNEIIKIRLAGIDAPEIQQAEGSLSKDYLESKIVGHEVELDCKGQSYGRLVCTIFLGGSDINEDMVRMGYALDYAKYSKGKYKQLMKEAQSRKLGIWKTLLKSPFCTRHAKDQNCTTDLLYNQ